MSQKSVKSFWLWKFSKLKKSARRSGKDFLTQTSSHLEKFSNRLVVEQKLLSVRLVAAVVHVLVKVPLQAQKRLTDHTRIVSVELDSFDQNTGTTLIGEICYENEAQPYVLWKSAICWKFIKIKSLLSRTILGTFFSGASIVLMYRSTTAWRSFPNSSSVSTSSRMTALWTVKRWEFWRRLTRHFLHTLACRQHHRPCHRRSTARCAAYRAHQPAPIPLWRSRCHQKPSLSI